MEEETKFKETEIEEILEELKKIPLRMECKILRIVEGKEGDFEKYRKDLLGHFESLINDYQKLSDGEKSLRDISHIVLLNSAFEGLVKIILFFDSPVDYLNIYRGKRTLGNLKNNLLKSIKDYEKNHTNILLIENLLEIIKELRNNFIHFPFYYEYDYRFDYMYFQLMAYLIEGNDLWDLVGDEVKTYMQEIALKTPEDIDLLGGNKLYETTNKI